MPLQLNYNYTLDNYISDIKDYGLSATWQAILDYCSENKINDLFNINNFGELYEIGLAEVNKVNKKELGKYFTPTDVANVLAKFFIQQKGEIICDVCCGTGNLILAVFNLLDRDYIRNLIFNNNLYLYDLDSLALTICKKTICMKYGQDLDTYINCIVGDFLDRQIKLPNNCKVICNPPYYKITEYSNAWEVTDIIKESKDLYAAFMEKIIKQSVASVIITPYSFVGANKFYSLRNLLNNYNGFIFSFDNVPGNIFHGRKHGIFNSCTFNGVRASITVVENKDGINGFRVSPLLRFKTEERQSLLNTDVLLSMLPEEYQVVDQNKKRYYKCFIKLLPTYKALLQSANTTFNTLLSTQITNYSLYMPTTCRYFQVATNKKLNRDGVNILYFSTLEGLQYAYCLLNSSFSYWHWRLYDGGITYQKGLLNDLPIKWPLTESEKTAITDLYNNISSQETNYLVYKKNANKIQENIKFPERLRADCNKLISDIYNINYDPHMFDCVHNNHLF